MNGLQCSCGPTGEWKIVVRLLRLSAKWNKLSDGFQAPTQNKYFKSLADRETEDDNRKLLIFNKTEEYVI